MIALALALNSNRTAWYIGWYPTLHAENCQGNKVSKDLAGPLGEAT